MNMMQCRLAKRVACCDRQSGMRVPHYLRTVKTPEVSEEALLNSSRLNMRASWPSSKGGTMEKAMGGYNMQAMFANSSRSSGMYAGQDGNKDHMAVVAAAMQGSKETERQAAMRSQAVTTATIRGILTGIK